MNSKVPSKLNHSMILGFCEMQNFLLLLVGGAAKELCEAHTSHSQQQTHL